MQTNKILDQQLYAFELMQEVMKRAHEEGLTLRQIHDTISCSAEDAKRIDQIFKEVQHDLKRT